MADTFKDIYIYTLMVVEDSDTELNRGDEKQIFITKTEILQKKNGVDSDGRICQGGLKCSDDDLTLLYFSSAVALSYIYMGSSSPSSVI